MIGHHLIHPGKAFEMMAVELARLRCADCGESAFGVPGEDRAVRYVRKTRHRQRSRPHAIRKIVVRRRLRCDPGFSAMRMNVNRD
jgi:hypothetical protein